MASDDENLVGFEQPSYRSDRLDKVFKSSDERGFSNRVALGIGDGERADLAIKGAAGKRLTYRQA